MRNLRWLLLPLLPLCAHAADLVTWDTNHLGSPVSIYRAELLGVALGDAFALQSPLPSGATLLAVGQGTLPIIWLTNIVHETNTAWIYQTNSVWFTNTVTRTNTVWTTNTVWRTNTVWLPPGKR